jgi:inosose dehydratase
LGLDSGHVANCGRNNVKIIRQNLERITQVHLKQLNPDVRERLRRETLSLAEAVPLALRCEPPYGEPDMPELRAALAELNRNIYRIIEQDLDPVEPHIPLPIRARAASDGARLRLGPVRRDGPTDPLP